MYAAACFVYFVSLEYLPAYFILFYCYFFSLSNFIRGHVGDIFSPKHFFVQDWVKTSQETSKTVSTRPSPCGFVSMEEHVIFPQYDVV